ncbi:MAG: LysR family transcriptional regulator [Burkholderiaceae bacterium]
MAQPHKLPVDLPGMRAAIMVASHGSFLRASVSMGISQSQLSRQVAKLETYVGRKIFHRHGRGVVLTDFGRRILPRIQGLLSELQAFDQLVRDARERISGDVTVGAVPVISRRLTSSLVRRLQAAYPDIKLRILEGYSGQIEEWLAAGRVDIGVFNHYGASKVSHADKLMRRDVAVIGPPNHPLMRRKDIGFDSLRRIAIAMPPHPNSLAEHIALIARERHVPLNIALEAGTASLIQEAMLASGLVTLAPADTYAQAIRENRLAARRLRSPVIEQTTWIATTTQHALSSAVRTVEALIKEILRDAEVA